MELKRLNPRGHWTAGALLIVPYGIETQMGVLPCHDGYHF